jgi:hypothetical protein
MIIYYGLCKLFDQMLHNKSSARSTDYVNSLLYCKMLSFKSI